MSPQHRRSTVARLQRAHAAHIQASYEELAAEPGNPLGAESITVGETRVFSINRSRLENRVLLTGNESEAELDRIFDYFDDRGVKAFLEVNPANFLPNEPFSWHSEIIPLLQARGCTIDAFRCAWYLESPPDRATAPRVERYDHDRFDEFLAHAGRVYPSDMSEEVEWARRTQHGSNWVHYVGFEVDEPVSTGTLFVGDELGFLAWWYTNPKARSRGHQGAGIRARAVDAFERGCEGTFAITDFSIQSAINLQRVGFRLAYNHLLVTRDPQRRPDDVAPST